MNKVERNSYTTQVTVTYPTTPAQIDMTQAEYSLIRDLKDRKVTAIKFVRDQFSLGLREAKDVVDTIHENFPV